MDVIARFTELRRGKDHLSLFALVDGLGYQRIAGAPLERGPGRAALFDGTPDAALADAGPWLVAASDDSDMRTQLLATQASAPYVSWLMAELPLQGLAQLLQLKLDVRLPGERTALLRFYDPRVLKSLAMTLTPSQREEFFAHVLEWHFVCDGEALRVGRADA